MHFACLNRSVQSCAQGVVGIHTTHKLLGVPFNESGASHKKLPQRVYKRT